MDAERVMRRLISLPKGARRRLRALRGRGPQDLPGAPEAWALLYEAAGGEELAPGLLRLLGMAAGFLEHASGRHPARVLRERHPRRLLQVLKAEDRETFAWRLVRELMGTEADLLVLARDIQYFGEAVRVRWARAAWSSLKEEA